MLRKLHFGCLESGKLETRVKKNLDVGFFEIRNLCASMLREHLFLTDNVHFTYKIQQQYLNFQYLPVKVEPA
jgi:hypothetical protein